MASGKALEAGQSLPGAQQTYDVSDKDGALLIGMGKAVEAAASEPKPKRTWRSTTTANTARRHDGVSCGLSQ